MTESMDRTTQPETLIEALVFIEICGGELCIFEDILDGNSQIAGSSLLTMLPILSTTAWIILFVVTLVALLPRVISPRRDPQEPPYLPATIPVIGHLLGVLNKGAGYYRTMSEKYPGLGLYGLPMLNGRMYIVSSADWATALEKRSNKSVSLELMIANVWGKIFCVDENTEKILKDNLFGDQSKRPNLMIEIHNLIHRSLAPSDGLEELKEFTLKDMAKRVNELARNLDNNESRHTVDLWSWIRHHMAHASMDAFYRGESPITAEPSLMEDFWVWEENAQALMMSPYPSILARKAYLARKRWFQAWVEWVQKGGYKRASKFIQDRAALHMGFGLPPDQYGLAEAGMPHALLVNMVPTSFWFISYIFRDLNLLSVIRQEIDHCIKKEGRRCTISVTKLRAACPLFGSTLRETLRLVAPLHTNRLMAKDTITSNSVTGETFLLKKDSAVQYASTLIHSSEGVWGNDAAEFRANRFLTMLMKSNSPESTLESKGIDPAVSYKDSNGTAHPGSFRAFGGGFNVCPGRHFAQAEIQGLTALFVAGFEIESEHGGPFVPPRLETANGFLFTATIKPERDVQVKMRRRTGYEDVEWVLEL